MAFLHTPPFSFNETLQFHSCSPSVAPQFIISHISLLFLPSFSRTETGPPGSHEVHREDVYPAGSEQGEQGREEQDGVPTLHLRHGHTEHPQGVRRHQGHGARQILGGILPPLRPMQSFAWRKGSRFTDHQRRWLRHDPTCSRGPTESRAGTPEAPGDRFPFPA